jgi:hypothetical protein
MNFLLMSHTHRSTLYPWYVIGVLLLVLVLSFVDRQILNLLVGPLRRDLGIGDTQMGLLLSPAFALVFVLGALPLGRMADRHSRRGQIAFGLGLWSLATALCGFAQNFEQLSARRPPEAARSCRGRRRDAGLPAQRRRSRRRMGRPRSRARVRRERGTTGRGRRRR